MRIALVCVHYPPLRSSCAIQMRDLAEELLQQGHEPMVIVPTEDLKNAWSSEMIDGVSVYRFVALKTMDIGYFRRAVNEVLLPVTMLYGLVRSDFPTNKLDAVIWYSPTIFFGPLVWFLKTSSKCPAYLILRDIFPEWAFDLGILKKGLVYYLFKLVAIYQYSVADIIGVQTSSNLNYLEKWANKPKRRLEVLTNWLAKAPDQGSSILIADTDFNNRKIFVYIGNMGIAQGMDVLIELAESLSYRQDIGFLFVGRGTEVQRLQKNALKRGLDNILFYDEIDPKEIPGLLAMCHVGLIALDPKHKSHNIPGKFLTYMQAGIPVLARINANTDLENIINNEGVGYTYIGNVIDEFKDLAELLIDNETDLKLMSKRGRLLSDNMFSAKSSTNQIISALTNYSQGNHC